MFQQKVLEYSTKLSIVALHLAEEAVRKSHINEQKVLELQQSDAYLRQEQLLMHDAVARINETHIRGDDGVVSDVWKL